MKFCEPENISEIRAFHSGGLTLPGAPPPPRGHPPVVKVLYYPYTITDKFSVPVMPGIALRPVPLGGLVAQEGGESAQFFGSRSSVNRVYKPQLTSETGFHGEPWGDTLQGTRVSDGEFRAWCLPNPPGKR
jgi:hypothetical protein